ncbi:hypothetical protein ACFFX0_25745 [Citricoccus parietis]|uniref:Uncharacterized protein n=1 Tax=Citricoccus parietis TaxID=592307 RepID=A0ABV5G625_9MICC
MDGGALCLASVVCADNELREELRAQVVTEGTQQVEAVAGEHAPTLSIHPGGQSAGVLQQDITGLSDSRGRLEQAELDRARFGVPTDPRAGHDGGAVRATVGISDGFAGPQDLETAGLFQVSDRHELRRLRAGCYGSSRELGQLSGAGRGAVE